jgi:hypothetical protein
LPGAELGPVRFGAGGVSGNAQVGVVTAALEDFTKIALALDKEKKTNSTHIVAWSTPTPGLKRRSLSATFPATR